MRKELFLMSLPILFMSSAILAQDKIWDFGNDTTNWPENSSAITVTTVVDGLTLEPGDGSGFGIIDGNNASWQDGYSASKRFKFGGNSGIDPAAGEDFIPERRFMTFSIEGPVAVKIWFRASGSGTPRSLYVTDGASIVAEYNSTGDTGPQYLAVDYTGNAKQLYVFCAGNAFNLYKLEISSSLLHLDKSLTSIEGEIKAIENTIYVSNLNKPTKIYVYNLSGALIQSFYTKENLNFSLDSGVYIVSLKTSDAQESVKLLVK